MSLTPNNQPNRATDTLYDVTATPDGDTPDVEVAYTSDVPYDVQAAFDSIYHDLTDNDIDAGHPDVIAHIAESFHAYLNQHSDTDPSELCNLGLVIQTVESSKGLPLHLDRLIAHFLFNLNRKTVT